MEVFAEHGLDALMRPVLDAVCQRLIVVSYCTPGSAHSHADSAICPMSSRAGMVFTGAPSITALRSQLLPDSTAA